MMRQLSAFLLLLFLSFPTPIYSSPDCYISTLEQLRTSEGDLSDFARAVGLDYEFPEGAGISRKVKGKKPVYSDPDGNIIKSPDIIKRLNALGVPLIYKDVWYSTNPDAHLQATGVDQRGRTQYRYHPRWKDIRSAYKFDRMVTVGDALPELRAITSKDLAKPGLPKEKIAAVVATLLDKTSIRIGNEKYADENESFGLTTLRHEHVRLSGSEIRFRFRGKSGVEHDKTFKDTKLAPALALLAQKKGEQFFQYEGADGSLRSLTSADVNEYLNSTTQGALTAKDFRTWKGTITAARVLMETGPPASAKEAKENIKGAVVAASEALGNTPSVCLKNYIAPIILDSYREGPPFWDALEKAHKIQSRSGLSLEENVALLLLKEHRLSRR